MQSKINWIDNLRGIACLMVVMIHTTTWYVTNAHSISPVNWDVANILNSASRVSVPLFFMISGFLFLASVAHSRDISSVLSPVCCFTAPFRCSISSCSLQLTLNVPCSTCCKTSVLSSVVFLRDNGYLSGFAVNSGKNVSGKMLLALMVIIGIVANPNTVSQKIDGFEWLPVNLYITGDTFYYVLYGMLGRAIGMMETQKRGMNWLCAAAFLVGVFIISRGTLHELQWRGNFADTWYLYCGPMVFICAISLLTLVKNTLNARPLPVLGFISRHSLGIYGFHALVIHALRTRGVELKSWPVLDIVWIFTVTLVVSLLLSMLLQRIDTRRFVS